MRSRRWLALALIALCVPVALWVLPLLLEAVSAAAQEGGLVELVENLRGSYRYIPFVILIIMVVRSLSIVIPVGPVIAANTLLFGPWVGLLVSWVGSLLGASAGFWLARVLGRDRIERLIKSPRFSRFEPIAEQCGFSVLFLGHFIPGVNSVIWYLGGLTSVAYGTFLAASALGHLPWIVFYTFFSHALFSAPSTGLWILLGILGLAIYTAAYRLVRAYNMLAADPKSE